MIKKIKDTLKIKIESLETDSEYFYADWTDEKKQNSHVWNLRIGLIEGLRLALMVIEMNDVEKKEKGKGENQ